MKNILLVLFLIVIFSGVIMPSDTVVSLNVNYSAGNSLFFGEKSNLLSTGFFNYTETSVNGMGMGFGTDLFFPVAKRLYLVPGAGINFGNQSYEFKRVEGKSDSDIKDNYYFHVVRTDLKLNYDLLVLDNGWKISLFAGAGYNWVKSDSKIDVGVAEFWNIISGIGVKFFQLKHFGFYLTSFYNYPIKNRNFEFLTLGAGIMYRL